MRTREAVRSCERNTTLPPARRYDGSRFIKKRIAHDFADSLPATAGSGVAGAGTTTESELAPRALMAQLRPTSAWRSLLHRHALRQIPRLVHIRPANHRGVIGEKLQRNRVD